MYTSMRIFTLTVRAPYRLAPLATRRGRTRGRSGSRGIAAVAIVHAMAVAIVETIGTAKPPARERNASRKFVAKPTGTAMYFWGALSHCQVLAVQRLQP